MSYNKAARRRQDIISEPIGQQLISLTIPMFFALVAIIGLGVVDSYFISYLGTMELAGIGFIAPITMIVTSFALGLGMAISSLNSKLVGAGQMNRAARLITDGFYLTALLSIISIVVLVFQIENIFTAIGADERTLPFIEEYMDWWVYAIPMLMFSQVCSSTFRSLGITDTAAMIAIVMTVSNIILDPLLIFGLGPFPRMEMAGAALATVISVCISTAIGFYYLGVRERLLLWAIPKWSVLKTNFSALLEIAIPAVLANAIVPITAAIVTTLVASFGNDAVAGFGVGSRIEGMSIIIVYALSSTLPMFIGQNLGAERKDRVYQAIKVSFRFTLLLQVAIYLLLLLFAHPIAALFSEEPAVHETITTFLFVVPVSYGFAGVVILINVSMNVLGQPKLALYINIIRMVFFYLPLAYLGGLWFGLTGLFVGLAVGNVCAYFFANILLNKILKEQDIKQTKN